MKVNISMDEVYPVFRIGGYEDFKDVELSEDELIRINKAMIEFLATQKIIADKVGERTFDERHK